MRHSPINILFILWHKTEQGIWMLSGQKMTTGTGTQWGDEERVKLLPHSCVCCTHHNGRGKHITRDSRGTRNIIKKNWLLFLLSSLYSVKKKKEVKLSMVCADGLRQRKVWTCLLENEISNWLWKYRDYFVLVNYLRVAVINFKHTLSALSHLNITLIKEMVCV